MVNEDVRAALTLVQSIKVRGKVIPVTHVWEDTWKGFSVHADTTADALDEIMRFSDLAAGNVEHNYSKGQRKGSATLTLEIPYPAGSQAPEEPQSFKLKITGYADKEPDYNCPGCDAGPAYYDSPGWGTAKEEKLQGYGKVTYEYTTYCPACLAEARALKQAAEAAAAQADAEAVTVEIGVEIDTAQ